jgi:hypothetical protein
VAQVLEGIFSKKTLSIFFSIAQNVFVNYIFLSLIVCSNVNTSFDRAHEAASGTHVFVLGTSIWANRFEKNANLSLTSLTYCEIIYSFMLMENYTMHRFFFFNI